MLNRRIHYWLTLLVALPLTVVVATGLMLQVKKQWTWVQPPEKKGTAKTPSLSFADMLEKVRSHDGFESFDWSNVQRIDVRPSKGITKLVLTGDWEMQLDSATGEIMQVAIRRSDWIESLHDGSYFLGDLSKLGIFFPAGVGLLLMLLSGLWLFWQPIQAKRRRRKSRLNPEN
ncbi:MAG: PepSY domain-containing protein [Pirellula sp.]|nr:PepSY domain-containing protein [Pirellula sp.]